MLENDGRSPGLLSKNYQPSESNLSKK